MRNNSGLYYQKQKLLKIFVFLFLVLRSLHMNRHQMRNITIFMTISNSRKGKNISHHSHKKHQNSTSQVKKPISPVRENISSVREHCRSPMRELSLFPVTEEQSPVRVATKAGKKRQGECNDQEKKRIRPSEDVFNQCMHHTDRWL